MSDNRGYPFPDPFGRNHCQSVAFAMMFDEPDAMLAASIASTLRKNVRRVSDHQFTGSDLGDTDRFLSRDGWSSAFPCDIVAAAQAIGLRVVTQQRHMGASNPKHRWILDQMPFKHPDCTAARFAEENPGRWFMTTLGHAFAIVDGVVYGLDNPDRKPVKFAFKMEVV